MRRLINDPYQIVEEMLAGYTRAFENKVKLIGEMGRVVVSKNAPKKDKVGVIIGGLYAVLRTPRSSATSTPPPLPNPAMRPSRPWTRAKAAFIFTATTRATC